MKINKNVLQKKYEDLVTSDKESIIEALELHPKTSMYVDKEEFILSMCEQREEVDYFQVKGRTMPKLVGEVQISKKQTSEQLYDHILSILKKMRIKPTCIFLTDGWAIFDFHSVYDFHFDHWSDYLRTVITFIDYLEELQSVGIELRYREPLEPGLATIIDKASPTLSNVSFRKELFNQKNSIEFYGEIIKHMSIGNI